MNVIVRPIDVWPGELTAERKFSPFDSTYPQTLELLKREVYALQTEAQSDDVIIQLALREQDIRQDGQLRANAKPEAHPGVIVSFETINGPMRMACDRFESSAWDRSKGRVGWHQNLRAVALALEALRKIERYGIGTGTEQYRGFQALGSGIAMPPPEMTIDEAIVIFQEYEGFDADMAYDPALWRDGIAGAYRMLSKKHHPDQGGDPTKFRRLTEARDLLTESA